MRNACNSTRATQDWGFLRLMLFSASPGTVYICVCVFNVVMVTSHKLHDLVIDFAWLPWQIIG